MPDFDRLPSPALVLFRETMERNLQKMIDIAGGPERLRVVLTVDGQPVTFEVTSPRSPNPLRLPSLHAFKCPGQQG